MMLAKNHATISTEYQQPNAGTSKHNFAEFKDRWNIKNEPNIELLLANNKKIEHKVPPGIFDSL